MKTEFPPIKERTNADRAAMGAKVLAYYSKQMKQAGEARDTVLSDLMADLCHLCSRNAEEMDFDAACRMGAEHAKEEIADEVVEFFESLEASGYDATTPRDAINEGRAPMVAGLDAASAAYEAVTGELPPMRGSLVGIQARVLKEHPHAASAKATWMDDMVVIMTDSRLPAKDWTIIGEGKTVADAWVYAAARL